MLSLIIYVRFGSSSAWVRVGEGLGVGLVRVMMAAGETARHAGSDSAAHRAAIAALGGHQVRVLYMFPCPISIG